MTEVANDPFSQPDTSQVKITDYDGRLLLITPTEYIESMATINGDTDAVRADIVVLDGPDGPEAVGEALIFQQVLISMTRKKVGNGMVLGRLGTGQKKPGKNAPWILAEYTPEEGALAKAYLAEHQTDPFS